MRSTNVAGEARARTSGARRVFRYAAWWRTPAATATSLVLALTSSPLFAADSQRFDRVAADRAAARLVAATGSETRIERHRASGLARFVVLANGGVATSRAPAASAVERAAGFLGEYGALFGLRDPRRELVAARTLVDRLGATHIAFDQRHAGIPVFGARLVVHVDAQGRIAAANGTIVAGLVVDTRPQISPRRAKTVARRAMRHALGTTPANPFDVAVGPLLVLREGLLRDLAGPDHLVYEVEVRAGRGVRELFYVDAHDGKVVEQITGIHDALARRVYEGAYKPARLIWSEGDAEPYGDIDVDGILGASETTYDLFASLSAGSYLSYDGSDHAMEAVHDIESDPNVALCPNAFWDGTTTNFCVGVTSDDIVAHEWTHAYTERTHGLIYAWQPGALNEAYSDIFGEVVDRIDGAGTDTPDALRSQAACSMHADNASSYWLTVDAPPAIAGDYPAGPADFGAPLDATGITGEVALADDGDTEDHIIYGTGTTTDACQPLVSAVAGKIVLADRGGCRFDEKAENLQAAGAIGFLVANNDGEGIVTMTGSAETVVIPGLFVGEAAGAAIRAEPAGTASVTLRSELAPVDDSWRWLIGEDASAFGGAIRDMWSPECLYGPGRVGDVVRYTCERDDGGGVHTNSSVPNHAFALLADGGTYNGESVAGIGLAKAAHIYWRAMSVYQVPASDFADHADALEQSCADLIGAPLVELATGAPSAEVVTLADCEALANALAAVELREPPGHCTFEPLLDPAMPPLCDGGDVALVFTEDFEGDPTPAWTFANEGVFDEYIARDWQWQSGLPSGRAGSVLYAADTPGLGDCVAGSNDQSGAVYATSPPILLPAGSGPPRLAFDHYVATEFLFDGGRVEISVNDGSFVPLVRDDFTLNPYNQNLVPKYWPNPNPLADQATFTGTDGGTVAGSWVQSQVELGWYAHAGDTIRLRFTFGTDGCNGSDGWYLDDLRVYGCPQPAGGLDPFLCHRTRRASGAAPFTAVGDVAIETTLDGSFFLPHYDLTAAEALCNPADVDGVLASDALTHLAGYEIVAAGGYEPAAEDVQVDDRFGRTWLDMRGSELLLVPAAASTLGPVTAPDPGDHSVDAYKCYKARKARRTPRFPVGIRAVAADELGEPTLYEVRKPSRLCAAADVDGAGVENEGAWGHLLCYKAKRASGEPPYAGVRGIHTASDFAELEVDTNGITELCVPATLTDLPFVSH